MKIKVMPVSNRGGMTCYKFLEPKHNDAYKLLSGQDSISQPKLDALSALGVDVTVIGEHNKKQNAA